MYDTDVVITLEEPEEKDEELDYNPDDCELDSVEF